MSGRSLLRIIISEGFLHPFSSRYTKEGQQSPRSPRSPCGPSQGWKLLCPWPFRKVAQWLCRKPLTLQGPFSAAARQINSSFRMKACSRSFLVKHHWNKLKIKLWTTSLLDPWANFTIWGLLLDELAPKAIELYESPHGNWCLCKALPRCGSFGSFGSFGSWRLNDTEICQAVMVLPAKWMSKIVETLQELGVQWS